MQYKSESTWLTVSSVDNGWHRSLATRMLSGVSSSPGIWHTTRIVLQGTTLQVYVDGRPVDVPPLSEPPRGRIGLLTYSGLDGKSGKSLFRNVTLISAMSLPSPSTWNATGAVAPFTITPGLKGSGLGSNVVRTTSAPLSATPAHVVFWAGSNYTGESSKLVRSSDGGLSFTIDEDVHDIARGGLLEWTPTRLTSYTAAAIRDGAFLVQRRVLAAGTTNWTAPQLAGNVSFVGSTAVQFPFGGNLTKLVYFNMLRLMDGNLLQCGYGYAEKVTEKVNGRWFQQYESLVGGFNYCQRSSDDGTTWTSPVNIDDNGRSYGPTALQFLKGQGDEVSVTQLLGGERKGEIVAYIRPEYEPLIWETRSTDSGANWTPMSRGAFIMEAMGSTCISTESGVLMMAGRGWHWRFLPVNLTSLLLL